MGEDFPVFIHLRLRQNIYRYDSKPSCNSSSFTNRGHYHYLSAIDFILSGRNPGFVKNYGNTDARNFATPRESVFVFVIDPQILAKF